MAETIRELSFPLFTTLLGQIRGGRLIESIHLHHTWRPRQSEVRGLRTMEAMQAYHLGLGWSDIAQHLTIAPEGGLWSGRPWNRAPASVRGHNGTAQSGPFMIEIVGDFDVGRDQLTGEQRHAVIAVVSAILERYSLTSQAVFFHRELSNTKTCPGTGVDPDALRAEIAAYSSRTDLDPSPAPHDQQPTPQGQAQLADQAPPTRASAAPFAHHYLSGFSLIAPDRKNTSPARPPLNVAHILIESSSQEQELIDEAELPGAALPPLVQDQTGTARRASREPDTTALTNREPTALAGNQRRSARVRRHALVLEMGRLDGEQAQSDLDAIFELHLPRFLDQLPADQTPRIVVFAHGGLVDEDKGLAAVKRDLDWWLSNGIYPIFLVWKTGWLEIFGQLWSQEFGLRRSRSDRFLEATLGPPARLLWSGIKRSARLAAATNTGDGEPGAAYLLARALRRVAARRPGLEIHTVGHSAGSVILAHFIETLSRRRGPAVASMHLLAPAVSLDLFQRKVVPRLEDRSLRALTVYTMRQELEEADSVIGLYRDSLLYFVSRAAEAKKDTPILGLEVSLRADRSMARLFGLENNGDDASQSDSSQGLGTVIWSKTTAMTGRAASRATTHGSFDEDTPTMESVLRRILTLDDAQALPAHHPAVLRPAATRLTGSQAPNSQPAIAGLSGERSTSSFDISPEKSVGVAIGDQFQVGGGVGRALEVRPHVRDPAEPSHRPLHIYTRDPDTSQHHGRTAVVEVPYEPLQPGPKGSLFEVVDHDDTHDLTYEPVDLDDPASLIHQGLSPSTTDPRFAQQMVYAVCQRVYGNFRGALGRDPCWGFDARDDDGTEPNGPSRLRIRPHAFEDQNAYYSKRRGELSFGYFPAGVDSTGRNQEGSRVYSALSHDIVVHEMSHALLDGLRARFLHPSNRDVLAFHEGFADLVAVFSNFSYQDVLESAIREAQGSLDSGLLIHIAGQFGRTSGEGDRPLRTVVDADQCFYDQDLEQHDLGSVLASAVFDAFRRVFEHKTRDLRHLAASHLRPGAPMPDQLVRLLARRASALAEQFLTICIRAIDYCPPVDLTFGEYLRALVTADFDLVPDDPWGYREALVDAFRRHRVIVPGVPDLSESALRWRAPEFPLPPIEGLRFEGMRFSGEPIEVGDRREIERRAAALGEFVTRDGHHYYFGLARGDEPHLNGDPVSVPVVESIRNVQRVGPDGKVIIDQVAEVLQERTLPTGHKILGGSTILVAHDGHVRYAIGKGVASRSRERRIVNYLEQPKVASQLAAADDQEGGLLGLVHRQRMADRSTDDA